MNEPKQLTDGLSGLAAGVVSRTATEQLLVAVERQMDEWDTELSEVLAGPAWMPLLRRRLAHMRVTAEMCRALTESMAAVATRRPAGRTADPDRDSATTVDASSVGEGGMP